MKRLINVVLMLLLSVPAISQDWLKIPETLDIRSSHPRLMIPKKEFNEMKKVINSGTNPALDKMHDAYMDVARKSVEDAQEFVFKKSKSGRLLPVSRKALQEIGACSYAFRFYRDKRYLKRAVDILEDVCNFPTWNPSHYLDVAEMANAVSLAYDWLYDKLTPAQRKMCEEAIVKYFFDTAENESKYYRHFKMKGNWGQVLNAALVNSSIAFYDLDPSKAQSYIRRAAHDVLTALDSGYAPDGIYTEGVMYWGYGTSYQIMMNEALLSAYGTDFGLSNAPGFLQSVKFAVYGVGNIGLAYNFCDSAARRPFVPSIWYFAARFDMNDIAYVQYKNIVEEPEYSFTTRTDFMHIYHASLCDVQNLEPYSDKLFYGRGDNPVVIVREGWNSDDVYLGAKGGSVRVGHPHMDAGSFVYEHSGVRWIKEPSSPGYEKTERLMKSLGGSLWKMGQNSLRWKMYGYNNVQHSTMTINCHDQNRNGYGSLEEVFDTDHKRGARFDLSTLYPDDATSVVREIYVVDNDYLEIVDTIVAKDSLDADVRWSFPTDTKVEVTSEAITMSKKGKQLCIMAEGADIQYTSQMQRPADVPVEFETFYVDFPGKSTIPGFSAIVPAGTTAVVKTCLKLIK